MNKRVFISKGSEATEEQRQFVEAILGMLKTVGLDPRMMDENEWSHEQPLKAIKKIITTCSGTVVIAFTRTKFERGKEIKKGNAVDLYNIALPTTWNHIEGALAYSLNMPILVIAENGLKQEGLIENGYDWKVYWTDATPEVVSTDSFRGFVAAWKNAVEEFSQVQESKIDSNIDPEKLSFSHILKSMTVPQIWATISSIIALLTAIAVISYKIGGGKFP